LNIGTADWAKIYRVLTLCGPVVLDEAPLVRDMALTLELVDTVLAGDIAQAQHTLLILPQP